MSKFAFRYGRAAILLASSLPVLGTSAANAGGAASGTVGTVTGASSQDGGARGGVPLGGSSQGPGGRLAGWRRGSRRHRQSRRQFVARSCRKLRAGADSSSDR
jgi:hypothetical protein